MNRHRVHLQHLFEPVTVPLEHIQGLGRGKHWPERLVSHPDPRRSNSPSSLCKSCRSSDPPSHVNLLTNLIPVLKLCQQAEGAVFVSSKSLTCLIHEICVRRRVQTSPPTRTVCSSNYVVNSRSPSFTSFRLPTRSQQLAAELQNCHRRDFSALKNQFLAI